MLLIAAAGSRTLMSERDLVRELMRAGDIVAAGISATEAGGIVEVIVLKFNEGGLAALGNWGTGGTVTSVAAGWTRCHRTQATVMKVLLHVGSTASSTTAAARAATTAARRTATRHTIRGRGTRRTGVARPEWAPQIREVERRRAARTLHFRRDKVAPLATKVLYAPRGPNFGASVRLG